MISTAFLVIDRSKSLSEIQRVLKIMGQYAFTYPGKLDWPECMEIAYKVAARHPKLREFHTTVAQTENMLVDLEDSFDLLEGVGLRVSNIYERRGIGHPDPSFIVSEGSFFWDVWRQAIPENILDRIRGELVEGAKKAASSKGFKCTSNIVFVWGTKP